jgi:hypothetical protein
MRPRVALGAEINVHGTASKRRGRRWHLCNGFGFLNTIAHGGTMLILLIILLLLAFGAFPTWPYSRSWGYYPSGGLGLLLLIVLIVALVNGGL